MSLRNMFIIINVCQFPLKFCCNEYPELLLKDSIIVQALEFAFGIKTCCNLIERPQKRDQTISYMFGVQDQVEATHKHKDKSQKQC